MMEIDGFLLELTAKNSFPEMGLGLLQIAQLYAQNVDLIYVATYDLLDTLKERHVIAPIPKGPRPKKKVVPTKLKKKADDFELVDLNIARHGIDLTPSNHIMKNIPRRAIPPEFSANDSVLLYEKSHEFMGPKSSFRLNNTMQASIDSVEKVCIIAEPDYSREDFPSHFFHNGSHFLCPPESFYHEDRENSSRTENSFNCSTEDTGFASLLNTPVSIYQYLPLVEEPNNNHQTVNNNYQSGRQVKHPIAKMNSSSASELMLDESTCSFQIDMHLELNQTAENTDQITAETNKSFSGGSQDSGIFSQAQSQRGTLQRKPQSEKNTESTSNGTKEIKLDLSLNSLEASVSVKTSVKKRGNFFKPKTPKAKRRMPREAEKRRKKKSFMWDPETLLSRMATQEDSESEIIDVGYESIMNFDDDISPHTTRSGVSDVDPIEEKVRFPHKSVFDVQHYKKEILSWFSGEKSDELLDFSHLNDHSKQFFYDHKDVARLFLSTLHLANEGVICVQETVANSFSIRKSAEHIDA